MAWVECRTEVPLTTLLDGAKLPVLKFSSYLPPPFFANGHFQTIFANIRRVPDVNYQRKRLITSDNDFLDIDSCIIGSDRTAIVSYGLEGNSHRPYVLGMVRVLIRNGWNAVVWNFRGCSGEPNKKLRSYHCGDTEDLNTVLRFVLKEANSRKIAMIGFSAGGNMLMKFLGEQGAGITPYVSAAVGISVPCDLAGSAQKLAMRSNRIYTMRFLLMLRGKLRIKKQLFPGLIPNHINGIKSLIDFDSAYTAPAHGFKDAYDYYDKSSCLPYLENIKIPSLLLNALDDPLLSRSCFPFSRAESAPQLYLETPPHGGHVGFVSFNDRNEYWSETRTLEFINDHAL
ncbi:MAG: YheT family hydrolase [Syntrophobacteraceae bacterium]